MVGSMNHMVVLIDNTSTPSSHVYIYTYRFHHKISADGTAVLCCIYLTVTITLLRLAGTMPPLIRPPVASPILLRLVLILTTVTPLSYCDVGTAAHYSPPYTRKLLVAATSYSPLQLFFLSVRGFGERNLFYFLAFVGCSYGLLRERPLAVPFEQPVRGSGGRDMGQRGGVREAVSGPLHQRGRGRDLRPEQYHPGPDRRQGRHLGVPAVEGRCHHRPLDHGLQLHREPVCSFH